MTRTQFDGRPVKPREVVHSAALHVGLAVSPTHLPHAIGHLWDVRKVRPGFHGAGRPIPELLKINHFLTLDGLRFRLFPRFSRNEV